MNRRRIGSVFDALQCHMITLHRLNISRSQRVLWLRARGGLYKQ
jgi:hypothetical protein